MKDNQRVVISKRMIKEGLLRLLERKPLEKISITELCDEADINRTTFYRHYGQPRDVLFEIEADLLQKIRFLCNTPPSSLQEAVAYAERILTFLYEQADLVKILIQYGTDEAFTYALQEFYISFLELKRSIHGISDIDDDSAKMLSTYCVGGTYFLLRQWLIEGIDKTPKEIADLIYRFVDKGITF